MRAMALTRPGGPLEMIDRPVPSLRPGQILVKIAACGVCRTDLHLLDGELPDIRTPIIPGHEVVGTVAAIGESATDRTSANAAETIGEGAADLALGTRVGIPWLGSTCGSCWYCRHQLENLCDHPQFTGYTVDGGYAEYAAADRRYCFPLPDDYSDIQAAPLLCAGLIGHRALKAAGSGEHLGIYGFGAAGHIVAQVARWQGRSVYAFTRPDDRQAQDFARQLGAVWTGASDSPPPRPLDAAILFAPVGALVPAALRSVRKGGTVVCAGIHMSEIPAFSYDILWGERHVRSVANLTREDAIEFLAVAPAIPVATHTLPIPLAEANAALDRLRSGDLRGAAVLTI